MVEWELRMKTICQLALIERFSFILPLLSIYPSRLHWENASFVSHRKWEQWMITGANTCLFFFPSSYPKSWLMFLQALRYLTHQISLNTANGWCMKERGVKYFHYLGLIYIRATEGGGQTLLGWHGANWHFEEGYHPLCYQNDWNTSPLSTGHVCIGLWYGSRSCSHWTISPDKRGWGSNLT